MKLDCLRLDQVTGENKLKIFNLNPIGCTHKTFSDMYCDYLGYSLKTDEGYDKYCVVGNSIFNNPYKFCPVRLTMDLTGEKLKSFERYKLKNGTLVIKYGEYLGYSSNKLSKKLLVNKTEKRYTYISDSGELVYFDEIVSDGSKYAFLPIDAFGFKNGIYFSIEPMEWLVDRENNIAVSRYVVSQPISNINNVDMDFYLDRMSKEIEPSKKVMKKTVNVYTNLL